jgi:hypothetical protein
VCPQSVSACLAARVPTRKASVRVSSSKMLIDNVSHLRSWSHWSNP